MPDYYSDENLRDRLKQLDESEDTDVSSFAAGFIESLVYKYHGPLSEAQREKAKEILDEYDF
jgi:hypothetical protein